MANFKKIFLISLVLFSASPLLAQAATFSVSPNTSDIKVGDTISLSVKLNTEGQAVNAVQTSVNFPVDKLKLISAVPGTIFNLLTPNSPQIESGRISFSAGAVSPGFTGASGNILTLKFSAIKTGSAVISLDSGKALLNDGFATNALTNSTGANLNIVEEKVVPVEVPVVVPAVPKEDVVTDNAGVVGINSPEVTSSNVSDQGLWYSTSTVALSWTRPANAYGFSFILDQNPQGEPDKILDTTVTTRKTYTAVDDGIWYFHIKSTGASKNAPFGDTATFQVSLDTKAPSQPVVGLVGTPNNLGGYSFSVNFASKDQTSGIAYYKVQVDDTSINNNAVSPYVIGSLNPGDHKIIVTAVDKAGNESSVTTHTLIPQLPKNSEGSSINILIIVLLVENGVLIALVAVLVLHIIKKKKRK